VKHEKNIMIVKYWLWLHCYETKCIHTKWMPCIFTLQTHTLWYNQHTL